MVGLMVTTRINELLDREDLDAYRNAQQVVAAAASVRDAVERTAILDGFTPAEATETLAVLDALPAAVDAAILAALRSALAREVPGRFEWHEGAFIELRTWEEPGSGRLHIVLVSPPGQTFVGA